MKLGPFTIGFFVSAASAGVLVLGLVADVDGHRTFSEDADESVDLGIVTECAPHFRDAGADVGRWF